MTSISDYSYLYRSLTERPAMAANPLRFRDSITGEAAITLGGSPTTQMLSTPETPQGMAVLTTDDH